MSGVNFAPHIEKLEPGPATRGGIVARPDAGERHVFQAPTKRSRLGLDNLAREKREEKEKEKERDRELEEDRRRDRRDEDFSLSGSELRRSPPSSTRRRPGSSAASNVMDDSKLMEDYQRSEETFDRMFYDADESGEVVDAGGAADPFAFAISDAKKAKKEQEIAQRRQTFDRANPHKLQRQNDQRRWEETQMQTSGVLGRGGPRVTADGEEEPEERVQPLMIRPLRPPFLHDNAVFTKQKEPVSAVRDPTSDMAVLAKKGSLLLRDLRFKRDRTKNVPKFWELGGSALGNVLGIKKEEPAPESIGPGARPSDPKVRTDGEVDYRAQSQFASHMQASTPQSTFSKTKTIRQQREFLPIFSVRDEVIRIVRDSRVVVLVGETGSGKTTQLTQYLLEEGFAAGGAIIACTQPRRVAAMSVAARVAEERGCQLGTEVGYAIRFEDKTSDATRIKYMTDGLLLREMIEDPFLMRYGVIIMDEAHERSLNTDVLFGLLKKLVARRADLRLIVTSATMDAERFAAFFGHVPVFTIPGRTFPVEVLHQRVAADDYVAEAVEQILRIHLTQPPGDILVFLTGQEDIEAVCQVVAERVQHLGDVPSLLLLPMYSQLPSDLQAKIFDPPPPGVRKCVVSTNVAETSITVDGIKYVVDSGYCKLKVFNPRIGLDSLQVTPISQANARQRQGRAGRTGPGVCWRLYTERAYRDELLANTVPEIQRTTLGSVVLLLKSLGVHNLLDFDFMDPPPQDNLVASMRQLWLLGALDDAGGLTTLGVQMNELPLDPPLAKMLLMGESFHCTADLLSVVAMLSVPTVFYRPKNREEEADSAREKLYVPESDHLTLLHIYQQWKMHAYARSWAAEHFLQERALQKVREARTQLEDILKTGLKMNTEETAGLGSWDQVRRAIATASIHNVARLKGIGEYVNMRSGMPCFLHPSSALYGLGFTPDYVVYHELVYTTKEYMQCATAVEPEWLVTHAPDHFELKLPGQSQYDRKRKLREDQKRMDEQMAAKEKQYQKKEDLFSASATLSAPKIAMAGLSSPPPLAPPVPRPSPFSFSSSSSSSSSSTSTSWQANKKILPSTRRIGL